MSSELRHRSKSMHGTTTGLLLKKFQLDSQRSHAIAQARNTSTTRLQVETDGSTDVIQAIINAAVRIHSNNNKSVHCILLIIATVCVFQPGCYPGDDGSSDIADRYNFFVHRKRFLFAPCSLGIFPESSRFRQALIWCITWKRFDQFILFLILANSTILAIADYSKDIYDPFRGRVYDEDIAMGLFGEQGAYLMDPWNWMDFIVVFIGILAVIPGIPNVSMLRVFRVLRPLRSLNAVAGMKKLVSALLKSIPELLTVVAFLCFLFFLYGVIGVQLWSGVLHPRCRITPYPLRLGPEVTFSHFDEYKGRQCFWPVADESPARTCSLGDDQFRQCPDGQICGSDYDDFGNFRFTHPDSLIVQRILDSSTYSADLNWGFLHFDNIGSASLAIFQCITREGWSDIMYMLQDAGYGTVAAIYFVSFIIFGSFFMLNLTLAVIWDNFSEASFLEAEERKTQKKAKAIILALRAAQAASDRVSPSRVQIIFDAIVNHWMFNVVQTILILLNTIILSLDQYPIDQKLNETVEKINFALTLAFFIEALLKVIGLGWKRWREDRYNQFDAVIVVVSTVEMILSPPAFIRQQSTSSTAASFSGLRSFRMFALFKLARSWPSLQKLLTTMISTLQEVGNFSVLFLLFLYIYALIGMQTFANQFRFDEYGFPIDRNHEAAYIPRANFDTLLWSVVTVFQILTGENWNVVMMDGWRSSGCTIELAIDNPLSPPDSLLTNILSWFDAVLTVLFMIEVAIKIIAYGFVLHKGAYLRNSWNIMDFVITATAAFFMFQGSSQFKFVKTLRTFRALRPLRMINRNPGLKLVVSSLIASIPQIVNVIMVCLLVFMIFSILAVNNLKGKFYSCQGDVFDALTATQQAFIASPRPWTNLTIAEQDWFNHSTPEELSSVFSSDMALTSRAICNLFNAIWAKTIPQNFDNVIHGIQTFFEMTTTEGWVTIMLTSVDATEIDMQPIANHHESWALFFISFILVGTFFVMQLFVGVVIENFNNMKEKLDGTFHLSHIQREWLNINEAMLNLRPVRKLKTPLHMTRRALFRIALSPTLELLIMGCVLLNTVFMAMDYFGEEDLYETGLNYLNYFFSGIFALEAMVKIIGLGKYYWKEPWNIFDFIVVLGTLFGVIYQMFGGSSVGTAASTVRSFRVGRPLCYRERWNDMMYELANQEDCTPDPPYDPKSCGISSEVDCVPLNGCGSPVAFVYLYSFTLLVTFILLNIFIAVILEGFAKEKDRQDGVLLPQHVFFNDVARRVGKFVIDELSDQPLESLPKSLNLEKRWRKYLTGRNIRKSDVSVHRLNQFSAAVLIHRSVNALIFREELNAGVQLFAKRSRSRVASLVTVTEQ
ncbi:Voltage-dependent channel, four helix bundle domain [Phytophthora cactorum]|nr:Voltage-dependent channel, four helix bundle domain [Phytophthora cactorum]